MMDTLMQFEILITLFFQHLGTWLTIPFTAITFLGNEEFYLLVLPALYWCIDAMLGFQVGVMLVLTNSINGILKIIFHSPRPFWVDSRVKAYTSETSFGLPSGHAQNAASIWGTLAVGLKKKWATIICVAAIILIGLSRIYLGVHFTRDVICGWLIGLALLLIYFCSEPGASVAAALDSSWMVVSFRISNWRLPLGVTMLATSPTFLPTRPRPMGEVVDISPLTTSDSSLVTKR